MSTMGLKKKIIDEVNSISDEAILTDIYQLLQYEQTGEYKLSEEENSAVQDGIEDIKQGRVFSSKEANSIIREWLKKKFGLFAPYQIEFRFISIGKNAIIQNLQH
jgi:hypothetical protein